MDITVRLHGFAPRTQALGPYDRCAVWFQGCFRDCPGCMSQASRPVDGGTAVAVDRLFGLVAALRDIEGVTVSGGEPFMQIEALHALLTRLRRETGLGVILYTGYYLDELRAMGDPKVGEILAGLLDILVDGPYVDALNDGLSLRGSGNQGVHHLTGRYLSQRHLYEAPARRVEVRVNDGDMMVIGVPDRATLEMLRKMPEAL